MLKAFKTRVFLFAGVAMWVCACSSAMNGTNAVVPAQTNANSRHSTAAIIGSTTGRVGLDQVFDFNMSAAQVAAAAPHDDFVWGAGSGSVATARDWRNANPNIVASRYMIHGLNYFGVDTTHTLGWFQTNHPTWILYACDKSGQPTHDPAYEPDSRLSDDVPLDIESQDATNFEVKMIGDYAQSHGHNAVAVDQFITAIMFEGKPSPVNEYGCGTWDGGPPNWGNFHRLYKINPPPASPFPNKDPQWAADSIAWATKARVILHAYNSPLPLIVNHPVGPVTNSNEQAIISSVDGVLDEAGFAGDTYQEDSSAFLSHVKYMVYAQQHGATSFITDKFPNDNGTTVTPLELEWSIATYLAGNEGAADLFAAPAGGYGSDQYHTEYATVDSNMGTPCAEYAGGPHVYYRKFTHGLVVLNAQASGVDEFFGLPAHTYTDLENRPVANPLQIAPNDAYVLFTTENGCS